MGQPSTGVFGGRLFAVFVALFLKKIKPGDKM